MHACLVKMRPEILSSETRSEIRKYAAQLPCIFASTGEGMGMNGVILAFHKDFAEYHQTLNQIRRGWKDVTVDMQSFVVALGEGEFKRFSLTHLADVGLKTKAQ
jgi:hypothetical protein